MRNHIWAFCLVLLPTITPGNGSGIALEIPWQKENKPTWSCFRHSRTENRLLQIRPSMILRGGQGKDEIEGFNEQHFIGDMQPLSILEKDYLQGEGNEVFRRKVGLIQQSYKRGWRKVKGDGNCFIRGYVYAALENLVQSKDTDKANGLLGRIAGYYFSMIDNVSGLGYNAGAIEDFYNDLQQIVGSIAAGRMTSETLVQQMNMPALSNSIVFFCRLMCSCYIQQNPDHFAPFIGLFDLPPHELKNKVKEYCVREVEPLEKEVEQLEVIGLTSAFGIGMRIEHLDTSGGGLNHHDFPEGVQPEIYMLYRPGHYDLLYP